MPNPSFENVIQCPFSFDLEAYTTNWKSARASPDYFNACATNTIAGVPNNQLGHQLASSGNAYIGMLTYRSDNAVYTEAASVQLLSPLAVGQTYYVSFKVNLTLESYTGSMAANNKIGVQFTKSSYSPSSQAPINNYAHVWTDSIITDTMNWKIVKGVFVADSNYTHLMLGNFFDKQYIDSMIYGSTFGAYYYFDDVCVSTNSTTCFQPAGLKEQDKPGTDLSFFPNPFSDKLTIKKKESAKSIDIFIYNIAGELVYEEKNIRYSTTIDTAKFDSGLFLVQVKTVDSITKYKLLKTQL